MWLIFNCHRDGTDFQTPEIRHGIHTYSGKTKIHIYLISIIFLY